jgi:predicted RNase H-like HicB family nuclease
MDSRYRAVVQRDGEWWIGWIEEIPGVNSQGRTRDELLENLSSALDEALEMNRAEARAAARGEYEEVSIRA